MYTIYKYLVTPGESFVEMMPRGARLLTVQAQPPGSQYVVVWAFVDTMQPKVPRRIMVMRTGDVAADASAPTAPYLGTVQMDEGTLAFHFFDGGEGG